MIFVFGSNLRGRHGAGAARYARENRGAIYGRGIGIQGESYAIPTKNSSLLTLTVPEIKYYIDQFICYADGHLDQEFQITRIGCGLAGLKDEQMAPLFVKAPKANCLIDEKWQEYLPDHRTWGTF